MKTLTDQENNDSWERSSIADNLLSPKCICKNIGNISPVFGGTFGIFRCNSKFQKFYVFIPWFLAEPLTLFWGTQGFSGSLVGKRWSTSYLWHRAQRHTILLKGQEP